jgi:hypothetical protein
MLYLYKSMKTLKDARRQPGKGALRVFSWLFSTLIKRRNATRSPDVSRLASKTGEQTHDGNVPGTSGVASHAPGSQPGMRRLRHSLENSVAESGSAGPAVGDDTLEPVPAPVPACGLYAQDGFSTSTEPNVAHCRVAPLPEGIPLHPGMYEWFDTDWKGVLIACPIDWKSKHRPLTIVDLPGKRVLGEVWEPDFTPQLARQAATMAVKLVELGRNDAKNGFQPYQPL